MRNRIGERQTSVEGSRGAGRITLAVLARIPEAGVGAFRDYEDKVLPLLSSFDGVLERRLRSDDGRAEVHIISFASEERLQAYLADPRRGENKPLLNASCAEIEVLRVCDVDGSRP